MTRVKAYRIIGTNWVVWTAWKRTEPKHKHHSVIYINGELWGKVGTERLSPKVEAIPAGSKERLEALDAHVKACNARAHAIIEGACKLPLDYERASFGEITACVDNPDEWTTDIVVED